MFSVCARRKPAAPDGTETVLRDALYNGQAQLAVGQGTLFFSEDASDVVFVSNVPGKIFGYFLSQNSVLIRYLI